MDIRLMMRLRGAFRSIIYRACLLTVSLDSSYGRFFSQTKLSRPSIHDTMIITSEVLPRLRRPF